MRQIYLSHWSTLRTWFYSRWWHDSPCMILPSINTKHIYMVLFWLCMECWPVLVIVFVCSCLQYTGWTWQSWLGWFWGLFYSVHYCVFWLKLLLTKQRVSGMDVITSCEMLAMQWLGAVMVRDLISVTLRKWSLYMCYDSAIVCLTGSTGIWESCNIQIGTNSWRS